MATLALYLNYVRMKTAGIRLEMEDDSGGALVIVLVLAEEGTKHVVALGAQRQSRIHPEVHSPARLHRERVFAVIRRLGLQVSAPHQRVSPGLPARPPRPDPYPPAAAKILYVLTIVNLPRK